MRYEKMFKRKIVHLRKTYRFYSGNICNKTHRQPENFYKNRYCVRVLTFLKQYDNIVYHVNRLRHLHQGGNDEMMTIFASK